jgi:mannose-6-phosphate isomerase-like protein (cupin superfamily)
MALAKKEWRKDESKEGSKEGSKQGRKEGRTAGRELCWTKTQHEETAVLSRRIKKGTEVKDASLHVHHHTCTEIGLHPLQKGK